MAMPFSTARAAGRRYPGSDPRLGLDHEPTANHDPVLDCGVALFRIHLPGKLTGSRFLQNI